MGMTIDNCIDYYNRSFAIGDTDAVRQHNDVLEMTIETMHKYQKIEDIVRDYYNEQYTDKLDIEIIEMISEVLEEDGNDDN